MAWWHVPLSQHLGSGSRGSGVQGPHKVQSFLRPFLAKRKRRVMTWELYKGSLETEFSLKRKNVSVGGHEPKFKIATLNVLF